MKPEERLKLTIEALDNFEVYPEIIKDMLNELSIIEAERKSIAQEFAEWVELKCVALCGNLWEFINDPYSEAHTSSELFDEFMAYRNETINCITFNKAAQNAIPADIRKQMDTDRAEAERQSIAIEFAEWCTINAKPVTNGKALRYWRLYTYQSSISYSTQHLFAKFMEERQTNE